MKQVLILLSTLMLSATAAAQNDREDMWEFGLIYNNQSSETLVGQDGMGSAINIDDDDGWGLSIAYNFTNKLALGADFIWSSPRYTAALIPDDGIGIPEVISHKVDLFTYNIKGTWNVLDGPVTPYLDAFYGWTNIDSNIADQPPITGCWWTWYGYVCDTFYSTYSKTRNSYGGSAGLRWDTSNGWTLKASYGFLEIDTKNAADTANLEVYRLDLAWLF